MSYSLNSTYVAFDTLSEDELRTVSKDSQLERGFVQDRPLFSARRIKPLKGGPSKSIDNGSTKSAVIKYQPLTAVGEHFVHIMCKGIEAGEIMQELEWDAHHDALASDRDKHEQTLAVLKAELANETTSNGVALDKNGKEGHERKISSCSGRLATAIKGITENAQVASRHIANMMGPYGTNFASIVHKFHTEPTTFTKTEYEVKLLPCMKSSSALMYPLEVYEDDSIDVMQLDTTDYKVQSVVQEVTHEVNEVPAKTYTSVVSCLNKLLIEKAGYGTAEKQRDYLMQNLKFPTSYVFTVREWGDLIKSISKHLPHMTSYKDDPEHVSDDEVVRANTELNSVELCKVLLQSMPQKIRERLKVHKPHLTLIKDFDGLIEQLDAILVNLKSERKSESNNQKKTGAGGGK
eukprot:scaffold7918_cov143-Skeletonema_marinoi.AAC.1